MKTSHILPSLVLLFSVLTTSAQQGINYNAIISDSNGDVLANTLVAVKFTILENGTTTVYQETHSPTTDANGILIVNIGEGTPLNGDFSTIDWGSNPHYLKTEIDIGEGITDMGTVEFKSVPYAMHAGTAQYAVNAEETDPIWNSDMEYFYTKNDLQTEGNSQVNWSNLTHKPTSLDGYGITDGASLAYVNSQIAILQDQIDALTFGLTLCDGKYVDLLTDPNNCGACGEICGPDQICENGMCVDTNPSTITIIDVYPTDFFFALPSAAIIGIEGLSQFNEPLFISLVSQSDGSITDIVMFNWEPTNEEQIAFMIPMGLDAGIYNIRVLSSDGSSDELPDAISITDQINLILTGVDPNRTLTGPDYPITISCDPNYIPFNEIPEVYLVPRSGFPSVVQLINVSVIDIANITAVVPEGTNTGLFNIVVKTPEDDYGLLDSALTIMDQ
jgi:hypothetical protein